MFGAYIKSEISNEISEFGTLLVNLSDKTHKILGSFLLHVASFLQKVVRILHEMPVFGK